MLSSYFIGNAKPTGIISSSTTGQRQLKLTKIKTIIKNTVLNNRCPFCRLLLTQFRLPLLFVRLYVPKGLAKLCIDFLVMSCKIKLVLCLAFEKIIISNEEIIITF